MDGTDFLAMDKFFPWLKSHFPVISQANMYFFSIGKFFLTGQKIFCPGRQTGHQSSYIHKQSFVKKILKDTKLCTNI